MDRELFTRKEVATFFGVTTHTIWKWEKRKVITPCLYVNGRPRYSREDLERVVAERQETYSYQTKTEPQP